VDKVSTEAGRMLAGPEHDNLTAKLIVEGIRDRANR
jgi:hypothetical protein